MKRIFFLLIFLSAIYSANAQKYITKNGYVGFFSHTTMEDIRGDNNQVASVLDISTGDLVFQLLVKSFHFSSALMEEHFNENYMESDKIPKSTFTGKIVNLSSIDFKKNGTYDVTVEGDLTIHGVTNKVSANGKLEVVNGGINGSSEFPLNPEDYKINIPALVREKIAKELKITVTLKYQPM